MSQDVSIKCPSCRRVHQISSSHQEPATCSRCGCELEELFRIKQLGSKYIRLGWNAACDNNYQKAMQYVEQSWRLSKEPKCAELGLWLSIIVEDIEKIRIWKSREC